MHKLFATLLILSLLLPSGCEKGKPTRPGPVPGKPGPSPTPAPVVKQRSKPKPRPKTTSTGEPIEPAVKVTPKVSTQDNPGDSVKGTAPEVTTPPKPTKPKTSKGTTKSGTSTGASTEGMDEKTRFRNAKAQAMEDDQLKQLKSKADGEVNEAEANKALKEYNKALFQKIRQVDPGVSDYSGKVEQSMTKRLSNEKAKE